MPTVRSSRNGLQIDIPADAAGVARRFTTPGDNELIFAKQAKQPRAKRDDEAIVVESLAGKKTNISDLA